MPSTRCNSIDSCYKYIESVNGIGISCSNSRSLVLRSTKGYNYIDLSNSTENSVLKSSIPIIMYADTKFRLSIDTSNGSNYSDYTFNSFDTYSPPYNLRE